MAAASSSSASADELDQLLDSALDEFTKLDLSAQLPSGADTGEAERVSLASNPIPVQGLGMELPDPRAPRRKRAAKQPKPPPPPPPPPRGNFASEALEKLTRETREAVRGLESATAAASSGGRGGAAAAGLGDDDAMVEEFVKQFEELTGSQDMESIVETMMQQLLSKEILHEPMKEIVERYPKWLDEHRSELRKEEYERYHNQFELMVKLNDVYENDPENFSKIVDVMQKMQECGQPPSDIVREIVPDLDLSNLGQLSPEMLESAPNCCVM